MRIVQIAAESNGGHPNYQANINLVIPEGWAVVRDGIELENFPFGEPIIEVVDCVPTVVRWVPGIIPEVSEKPQWADAIEAQVTYTAMMTDTLLVED